MAAVSGKLLPRKIADTPKAYHNITARAHGSRRAGANGASTVGARALCDSNIKLLPSGRAQGFGCSYV